jgi:hypothetical protein
LNYQGFVLFCFLWYANNIPNSDANEYSTLNTFNSGIDKYYIIKEYGIADFGINEY